jgi:hypothetical protein
LELALTHTSKHFGFSDKTDRVVLDDGSVIGRIFLALQGPPDRNGFQGALVGWMMPP